MNVTITWRWEDVQVLHSDWDERTCRKALAAVGDVLKQLSTQEGWKILRDLLDEWERPAGTCLCEQLERDLGLTWCKEGHLFDGKQARLVWSGEGAEIRVKGDLVDAFDYYNPAYDLGVHPVLAKWSAKRGLYWECYDPGTFFLYKI